MKTRVHEFEKTRWVIWAGLGGKGREKCYNYNLKTGKKVNNKVQ